METKTESKPSGLKHLMQMTIQTEGPGKGPHYKRVKIYPKETLEDPRPFIVKDVRGDEVELEPNDQFIAEKTIFGTARPETLQRLEKQGELLKSHSRR